MKNLRGAFAHLEEYEDSANKLFTRYEAKRRKQTEQILELEDRLAAILGDEESELLGKLSDAYAEVEAIAADFFLCVGLRASKQVIKAILKEEDTDNMAAKAAEIMALMVRHLQDDSEQEI